MKAVVCTQYGFTDTLKLKEVEKPIPKDNEVLIKVQTASVNSWDWDLVRGKPFIVRLGALKKPKYEILGADIAGRVEAIGQDVKQFLPGDEVFGDISGCGWGGFAEFVCAHENALTKKPPNMTFEEAASIPQAGVLALQGLRDSGKIQEGQKILINGAGGGVGSFALQIAKLYKTEVTGVDSTTKLDTMRSFGADHVIDYTQEDFTQNGQHYDLILDVVGNRTIFEYKRLLCSNGTYVMVGGPFTRIFQLILLSPLISLTGKKKMTLLIHKPNKKDIDTIKNLAENGKLVPVIDRCYPLSEVSEALGYLAEGHARGKIIIRIEDKS
ncbi:NAD(P)-dependent alcohol dehydrogenase [Psychrobacillus sp. FJAT-51614]|uniref:NAD(P)-dependent alcohol dehydrogenase n=1 Tax=Psychrobacillus mangrovi TaxID=3117745 RepID=A0ABU8F7I7_9BACI